MYDVLRKGMEPLGGQMKKQYNYRLPTAEERANQEFWRDCVEWLGIGLVLANIVLWATVLH